MFAKPESSADRIGSRVREKRLELKWSQLMLAKKSNVGLNFVCQLEHGKETVQLDCITKVLRALDLEVTIP
ncbi:MAG TPA: helix-turn-helix transcriptional regulator [Patescibacteria group bacterium]|nr:helix-turn-helix transcriptional regulator [Patescibacteria group bacterium]